MLYSLSHLVKTLATQDYHGIDIRTSLMNDRMMNNECELCWYTDISQLLLRSFTEGVVAKTGSTCQREGEKCL